MVLNICKSEKYQQEKNKKKIRFTSNISFGRNETLQFRALNQVRYANLLIYVSYLHFEDDSLRSEYMMSKTHCLVST